MAETKKYLDLQGLQTLVTNIKAEDKKNADAIDALKLLHAEGKTVAQEAAAAVASIVSNSTAAIDSITDIANWIGTGDVEKTTAAAMLSDISALKTKVGNSSVAAQVTAVTGTPDTGKTLQDEIDAVESTVAGLQAAGGEPNVITSVKKNGTALTITNKSVDVTFNGAEVKLTGYSKAASVSAVAATDTVNAAIGKLEKALDGKAATHSHPYAPTTHNHTASEITDFATEVAKVKVASATAADSATSATQDAAGNVIASTYATKTEVTNAVNNIEVIDTDTINGLFA